MDTAGAGILCICCAALGLTLGQEFIPAEQFRKQIRLLMTVLLLTVILSQLRLIDLSAISPDSDSAEQTAEDILEKADAYRTEAVAEQIRTGLNRALEEHGAPCSVAEIIVHIPDDGSIRIERAVLSGNVLTGTVYLREWLGGDVVIEGKEAAAGDPG